MDHNTRVFCRRHLLQVSLLHRNARAILTNLHRNDTQEVHCLSVIVRVHSLIQVWYTCPTHWRTWSMSLFDETRSGGYFFQSFGSAKLSSFPLVARRCLCSRSVPVPLTHMHSKESLYLHTQLYILLSRVYCYHMVYLR